MLPSNLILETEPLPLAITRAVLPAMLDSATAMVQVGVGILRWPFDAARTEYARGVQVGLFKRSILAARDFEVSLGALERLTLGPLARHR